MAEKPLVRTIYLYLFTLVGLALVIISLVRFIDLGLKTWVFTKADQEQTIYQKQPTTPYFLDRVENLKDNPKLTEEELVLVGEWLDDYETWQNDLENFDSLAARRQREASTSIAMILVGLPLYLYHWGIIRRETRS